MSKTDGDFVEGAEQVAAPGPTLDEQRRARIAEAKRRVADELASARKAAEDRTSRPFADNAEEGCTATTVLIHLNNEITTPDPKTFMKVRLSLVGSCGQEHWVSPLMPKTYQHGIREVQVSEINEVLAVQGYELARRVELSSPNLGTAAVMKLAVAQENVKEESVEEIGEESQALDESVGEESQELAGGEDEGVQIDPDGDAGDGGGGEPQELEGGEGEVPESGEVADSDVDEGDGAGGEVEESAEGEEVTTPEHSASVETSTEAKEVPPVEDTLFTTYSDGAVVGYVTAGNSAGTPHIADQVKMHAMCNSNYSTIPQPDKLAKLLEKGEPCQGCMAALVQSKSAAAGSLTGKMTRIDTEMVATDELLAKAGLRLVQDGQIVDHKASSQKGVIQGEEVGEDGHRRYLIAWNGKEAKAQLANMFRLNPPPDWSELRLTALRTLAEQQPVQAVEPQALEGPSDELIAEMLAGDGEQEAVQEPVAGGEEPILELNGFTVGEEVIVLGNPSRAEHAPPAVGVIEEFTSDGAFVVELWNDRGGVFAASRVLKPEDLDEWIIANRPAWRLDDATVPGAMTRPDGWRPPHYTRVELLDLEQRKVKGEGEIIRLPDDDPTSIEVLWDDDESNTPEIYGLEEVRLLPPVPKSKEGPEGEPDAPAYAEGRKPGGGLEQLTDDQLRELLAAQMFAAQAQAPQPPAAPAAPAVQPKPKPGPKPVEGPAAKLPKKTVTKTGVRTGASTGVDKGNPYTEKVDQFPEGSVGWHVALMDNSLGAAGYKNDALGRHIRGPAQYIDHLMLEELDARAMAKVVIEQRMDGKNSTSTLHNMMLVARLCAHFGYTGNIEGWRGLANSEEFMEELENEDDE